VVILKRFGELKAQLRQTGKPLPDFDLLIASTALAEDRVLVTNNTRHYQRIMDLQLENWIS
jgi:tRNA(fMet)-specific endonuclease VapC